MKIPKFRSTVTLISISLLCYSQGLYSQFSYWLLEINPSPVSTGIGGAGVALTEYDTYCMNHNPALPALGTQNISLNFGSYVQKNELYKKDYIDNFYSFGGYSGLQLHDTVNPLSIAIGYLRQDLKLKYPMITETTVIFHEYLFSSEAWNISMCYDFGIKLGFGINVKFIDLTDKWRYGEYESTAFDIGMIGLIPVLNNIDLTRNMHLDLNVGVGASVKNLGSKIGVEQGPRSSVLGYSINSSIKWLIFDRIYESIKLEWTSEADNQLYAQDSLGGYVNIYSDLQPINNYLLLKGSKYVSVHYGLAISIMDVLQLYFGAQTNCIEGDVEETQGWAIHLNGLLKALDSSIKSSFWSDLTSHFDLYYYNYSHISSYYNRDRRCFIYEPYDRNYSAISLKIFGY